MILSYTKMSDLSMNMQELMAELDEHKQNIPENLYLQFANLLKEIFEANSIEDEGISDDDEDDAEDEEEVKEGLESYKQVVKCLKIVYNTEIKNVLLKHIKHVPFDNYMILIKEYEIDDYDTDMCMVFVEILNYILNLLSMQACKDLIDVLGGYELAKKKYEEDHQEDKEHMNKYKKMSKLNQYKKLIAGMLIAGDVLYDNQNIDRPFPSILEENVIDLSSMNRALFELNRVYSRNY